jgi:cellulose synthase/poly-beta-1,6-N-acetylglucosamine synthase-like glycosyltransferase
MISFLITSFKEPKSIPNCLGGLLSQDFLNLQKPFEVLLACPDLETLYAALSFLNNNFLLKIKDQKEPLKIGKNIMLDLKDFTSFKNLPNLENIELDLFTLEKGLDRQNLEKIQKIGSFKHIKDPQKGKPWALNLLFKRAAGKIWILTDGDTFTEKTAVCKLLEKESNTKSDLISARPVSTDSKENFWGYIGHLLADSADHKRKNSDFFPVTGYLFLMQAKKNLQIPSEVLSDDAYISYLIKNYHGKITYQSKALVYIKYAKNLQDFLNQKRRSLGGFSQLSEFSELNFQKSDRSFKEELKYFFFPLKYAKNLQELFFSILLYPLRLYLWVLIFIDRKILKKDFKKTWVRIESTK